MNYKKLALAAFVGVFAITVRWFTNFPADKPVERIAEEIIEEETDVDLDLSQEECNQEEDREKFFKRTDKKG